jgi:superfamily I DNA/RNA helicase
MVLRAVGAYLGATSFDAN